MPNYLDILNQMQDSRRANLAEYNPDNPYSGTSYTHQSAEDIYAESQGEAYSQEIADDYIPSSMYTPATTAERGVKAISNISTASTLSEKISPTLSKIGDEYLTGNTAAMEKAGLTNVSKTITNPEYTKWVAEGSVGTAPAMTIANPTAGAGPIAGVSAGGYGTIGAVAYAMANDNNPYTYDTSEAVGMGVGDAATATSVSMALGVYAPWVPIAAAALGWFFRSKKAKKMKKKEKEIQVTSNKSVQNLYSQNMQKERKKRDYWQSRGYRDQGNLPYGQGYGNQAAQGMRYKFNTGGKNIGEVQAEFTGNELIVNNQDVVESGLKEKNYSKAAEPIRQAMRGGKITPGPETHKNNPMPVTSDGTIYAAGGALPFKVGNGAGVYDHASDQFKSTMSDKQIAMVAQKNINKWKSNNMYS
jgi:hypothetical protein